MLLQNKASGGNGSSGSGGDGGDSNCSAADEVSKTQKTFEDPVNMNQPNENHDSIRNGHRKKKSMTVYLPAGPEAVIEAKEGAS